MNTTILNQDTAMICLRIGCRSIWEGPSSFCPRCGEVGATFLDLEDLANSTASCTKAAVQAQHRTYFAFHIDLKGK